MKLISYIHDGLQRYGAVVDGDRIIDLHAALASRAPDLKSLLAADLLSAAAETASSAEPTLRLAQVELLPVIPNPGQIFCVGLNYHDHVDEVGRQVTEAPTLFVRVAASQVGHDQPMVLPRESSQLDFEGEIAVVIGKPGRRIDPARALEHVAGYSCYNDGSVRDWQKASSQWTAGKNFHHTGAFGPWLVTADEVAADMPMTLVTRLNGVEVQRARTDQLIHSIPNLLSYISRFVPLAQGDVIVTGTPGGVGMARKPPLWMKDGDIVEVEVDAIGTLRNTVRAES